MGESGETRPHLCGRSKVKTLRRTVKTVLPLVFCAMLADTTACPVTPGENLGLTLGTSFSFARLVVKFH